MNKFTLLSEVSSLEVFDRVCHYHQLQVECSDDKLDLIQSALLQERDNFLSFIAFDASQTDEIDLDCSTHSRLVNSTELLSYGAQSCANQLPKCYMPSPVLSIHSLSTYFTMEHLQFYGRIFDQTFYFHNRQDVNTHILSLRRALTIHALCLELISLKDKKIYYSDCNIGVGDQLYYALYVDPSLRNLLFRPDVYMSLESDQLTDFCFTPFLTSCFIKLDGYGYDFLPGSSNLFLWSSDILNLSFHQSLNSSETYVSIQCSRYWINKRLQVISKSRKVHLDQTVVLDLNSSPAKASISTPYYLAKIVYYAITRFTRVTLIVRSKELNDILSAEFISCPAVNIVYTLDVHCTKLLHQDDSVVLSICVAGIAGLCGFFSNGWLLVYNSSHNPKWAHLIHAHSRITNETSSKLQFLQVSKDHLFNDSAFSSRIISDMALFDYT